MTAQTGLRQYLSFHGPWDENFALYYKSYKDINENMWPEDKKFIDCSLGLTKFIYGDLLAKMLNL